MSKPTTIDQYIQNFPPETQDLLQQVRQAIQRALPQATEGISYAIPAFKVDDKFLIYFSGAKKHVAMYPFTSAMAQALPETANYDQSGKGTIRFPLDQPIPANLVAQIAQMRLDERSEED